MFGFQMGSIFKCSVFKPLMNLCFIRFQAVSKVKSEPSEGFSSAEKIAALSSHNWTEKIGWPCHRCDRDIKGLGKYVNHLEDFHPDDDAIFCPFCERISFEAKKDLRRHVVLEHKVSVNLGC